jgi:hypothetical protein
MSTFGNALATQMHEIRQLSEFSIPKLIFSQFFYKLGKEMQLIDSLLIFKAGEFSYKNNHTQIPAFTLAQELLETSVIRHLRSALKCANHRSGQNKNILTAADLESLQQFK